MSRFIEVPARMLPPETLDALLEAFVTRRATIPPIPAKACAAGSPRSSGSWSVTS